MKFQHKIRNIEAWMLPTDVFKWIEDHIPYGSCVLEFGSGVGTKRLCKNYTVTSIENDEDWLNKTNSTYIHAPLKNRWYDIDVLSEALKDKGPWDLIIIDGPMRELGDRDIFIDHFKQLGLDCGCPFIVDDAQTVKRISESLESEGYSKQTIITYGKTCDVLVK